MDDKLERKWKKRKKMETNEKRKENGALREKYVTENERNDLWKDRMGIAREGEAINK